MRSQNPKSRRRRTSQTLDKLIFDPSVLPDEKSLPPENQPLSTYLKADVPSLFMLLGTALGQVAWFRGAVIHRAINSTRNKLTKEKTIKRFGIGRSTGYRFLDIFECYTFVECFGKTMDQLLKGITYRRNKAAKSEAASSKTKPKPQLCLSKKIINRQPPKVTITEQNVIAEVRRAVAIVKGVLALGRFSDHVDDASEVLIAARRRIREIPKAECDRQLTKRIKSITKAKTRVKAQSRKGVA